METITYPITVAKFSSKILILHQCFTKFIFHVCKVHINGVHSLNSLFRWSFWSTRSQWLKVTLRASCKYDFYNVFATLCVYSVFSKELHLNLDHLNFKGMSCFFTLGIMGRDMIYSSYEDYIFMEFDYQNKLNKILQSKNEIWIV